MSLFTALGGRRGLQVGVLTAALFIVLVFLALDTIGRPQQVRTVWVLTRSVAPGATIDASSARETRIPSPADGYTFLVGSPDGKLASHSLSPGDILRQDDIESAPRVIVPARLGGFQASAGDLVDIYSVEGGRALLIGRGITVIGSNTIEVPASDEPLWIALYGSSASLVSARSNGTGVPDSSSVSGSDATRRLSILAQQPIGASPSP